jgi:membrane protease YdiL (CAAX protease family)
LLCSAAIVAVWFTTPFVYVAAIFVQWFPSILEWAKTPASIVCFTILNMVGIFFVALCFSRTWRVGDFLRDFRLQAGPDLAGWLAGAVGLGLALIVGYLASRGVVGDSSITAAMRRAHGTLWHLNLILFVSPFLEEPVMRGYLYPALRRSYGILSSVFVILVIAAVFHYRPMLTSLSTGLVMSLLTIVLCVVREKTGNLWNCILCHFLYNMLLAVRWKITLLTLGLLLPLCAIGWIRKTEK